MAFTKKNITLTFKLGGNSPSGSSPTFVGTNSSEVKISGLRVSCKIVKSAAAAMNLCELRVFGLTPTVYNSLTSIYNVTQGVQQNTVVVEAGDDTTGMSTVFIGQINVAQIDLNQQPESVMNIVAQSAYIQNLQPVPPTVYPSKFSISSAMQSLATLMKMNFESNGVTGSLPAMTLTGTARNQAIQIMEATQSTADAINLSFDDDTLVIFPKNGNRTQQAITPVSPSTGMIGYPSYSTHGIGVRMLYNPNIKWGAQINLQSSLQVANLNGLWTVYNLVHTLESEMPEGRWDTEIQAANFAAVSP